jgi:hypothetical protein
MPIKRKIRVSKKPTKRRIKVSKPAKKEIKEVVQNELKKEHALKYFDAQSNDVAVAPLPSAQALALKQVSVIGYSSTTPFDEAGATLHYGPNELQGLYLTRPFKESNTTDALSQQALNGQYCAPKMAVARYSIERVFFRQPVETGDDLPPDMAATLPISYRIIKVGFKASNQTQMSFDPRLDLFIDEHGQATGIDKPDFTRLNCRYNKINTKKYTKLMDMYGTIQQNNIFSENSADATSNRRTDIVTGKNGRSFVHFSVPFQLSLRKGGKLFYESPDLPGTNSFTSGGQRQLLLMHFWFDNGHNLLGGSSSGEAQPQAPTSADIQIKHIASSGFVDSQ